MAPASSDLSLPGLPQPRKSALQTRHGKSFTFGPFVLDPERQVLLRDGATLPLGQRALALLMALARAEVR